MAVYKLYPNQDAFLASEKPKNNTGFDEILEISSYPTGSVGQASRALVRFKSSEITTVVNNTIGSSNFPWSASLDLNIASALENATTQSVYCYPVYSSWDGGTGKYGDNVTSASTDKTGCSWRFRQAEETNAWLTSSFPANVTASFNSTHPGGGTWYTGSGGVNLEATQSLGYNADFDLDLDVTNAVKLHYSGTIDNNGFIVKLQDSLEFNMSSSIRNTYFSSNTNTIYPPALVFKWDDSSYDHGSLGVLSSSNAVVNITNNKGEYTDEGKTRFRLLARPVNPVRTFTTGSIYKVNHALPSASYYAIQDAYTEELEIPFDTSFTKISCDSSGPYFDIYMSGLQPERYYKVIIKSTLDGTTSVIDNDNIFKVVRNG
tara:strand:+ start:2676 stop:3800 length:1125 start_codon:yes stop_codon:yes gene_type:complete